MRPLLRAGADPLETSEDGGNVLHFAVGPGEDPQRRLHFVAELVKAVERPTCVRLAGQLHNGVTPVAKAMTNCLHDIRELLMAVLVGDEPLVERLLGRASVVVYVAPPLGPAYRRLGARRGSQSSSR